MKDNRIVIVGAGPYGLSVAAHFRAAGIPYRIFGKPLESWRTAMPEGMVLKSEPVYSNLWDPKRLYTFERFCAEKNIPYQPMRHPLSNALFLDYAEWFRQRAVGDVDEVKVKSIRRSGQSFTLDLTTGATIEADSIILATGHMAFQRVPNELAGLPAPLCLHSAMVHKLSPFAGRDVTVIGAGQSAIETLALLHENGAKVRLVARTAKLRWNSGANLNSSTLQKIMSPDSGLGHGWSDWAISELPQVFRAMVSMEKRHHIVATSWGPSGAWWLRDRVDGRIETLTSTKIRSAVEENGRVRLSLDGPEGTSEIVTDHVIAATGYEVDIDRLEYLDPGLRAAIAREGAAPLLSPRFETSVPGLYIIGIAAAPTFGPVMRFMFGAKHVGPTLVRRLRSAATTVRSPQTVPGREY